MNKRLRITLFFLGGFGNQLYTYSFGKFLSEKYNMDVSFDTSLYKTDNKKPEILNFRSSIHFKSYDNIIIQFRLIKYLQFLPNFISQFLIFIFSFGKYNNIIFENNVDLGTLNIKSKKKYTKNILNNLSNLNTNKSIALYGYWQSLNLFDEIRSILINDISLKNHTASSIKILEKIHINENSIMLHIRGNDIADKYMDETSIDYYRKSINYFNQNIKNSKYFVFTDDIDYAKSIIRKNNLKNYILVRDYNFSTIEEFFLMTKFKNYIVPKSTFSWWACYLSQINYKEITLPSTWFRYEPIDDTRKLSGSKIIG